MTSSVPAPSRTWAAPRRPGYDASAERTAGRVLPKLAGERVVWLSTVRPDGTPHLVPTWFWWDGEALVVFSKPEAVKVRNLRANPRLMVAVGDPEDDFDVGLIEADAELLDGPAAIPDAFFAKYAAELGTGGLDHAAFRAMFTQAVRITPTRFLAWHGRGEVVQPAVAARRTSPQAALGASPAGIVSRVAAALGQLLRPSPVSAAA